MKYIEQVVRILQTEPYTKLFLSVLFIFLISILKWVLTRFLERKVLDAKSRYRWRKTISYTLTIIGIILIAWVWFEGISPLATYFGLLSAGLAIALKDMLADLAGWLFIIWRKPFEVGNRIQIGDHAGDVIDIRPFQFTMLEIGNWVKADQSTGRLIHIPNGTIFVLPLCNYDAGFKYIWNEIPVMVTLESNWEKAKTILKEIGNQNALDITPLVKSELKMMEKQFLIFYHTLTPAVYTSVESSGILLTIRYLTEIRKRRGTSEAIWESILREFARQDDISLAYTTYRIYQEETASPPNKP